ncbi:hypothetical protein [Aeromonas phage Asp37]|nr:hypothetical protein [Aeromonas phage Asp37]
MSLKVYQEAHTTRLFRVHAHGKVETSTNGKSWYKVPVLARQLNEWRKQGTVTQLNKGMPDGGQLALIERELAYLERYMGEADNLRQLIPVHPTMNSAYERKSMQTVKGCPTTVRGTDEWDAGHFLSVINKGLSLPAKMAYRGDMIEIRIKRLNASRCNLLAQGQANK